MSEYCKIADAAKILKCSVLEVIEKIRLTKQDLLLPYYVDADFHDDDCKYNLYKGHRKGDSFINSEHKISNAKITKIIQHNLNSFTQKITFFFEKDISVETELNFLFADIVVLRSAIEAIQLWENRSVALREQKTRSQIITRHKKAILDFMEVMIPILINNKDRVEFVNMKKFNQSALARLVDDSLGKKRGNHAIRQQISKVLQMPEYARRIKKTTKQ